MAVNIRQVKEAGISQRAVDYIYNVIDPEQKKAVIEDEAFKDTINAIKATDSVPKDAIEITKADSNSISQLENGKGKTFVIRGDLNFGKTLNIPSDITIYVDGTITKNGNHTANFVADENNGDSVDAVFRVDDKSNVKLIGVNNAKLVGNQRTTGVYIEGSDNVEVRGFDIGYVWEGVVSHWGNNNVKILNNYIHDTGKRAIWTLGSKGTQAAHNFIENAGGDAFDFDAYSTASLAYENIAVGWRRWAGFVEEGAQDSYYAKNIGIMAEFDYKHPNPDKVPDKGYTMGWADAGTTPGLGLRLTQNNYFIGNTLFKPSSYQRKSSGGDYFARRRMGKGQTYFWGNKGNVGYAKGGPTDIPDSQENSKDAWYKANLEPTVAPGQSTLDKFEALFPTVPGSVAGNNGGQTSTNPKPPTGSNAILIQAEDMQLGGEYRVEKIGAASGGEVISLRGGNNDDVGTANFDFTGSTGTYDLKINYFDENDGVGQLTIDQGSDRLISFQMNKQLGSSLANEQTMTSMEISDIFVSKGDNFRIEGIEQGLPNTAEHVRIDSIQFIPTDSSSTLI